MNNFYILAENLNAMNTSPVANFRMSLLNDELFFHDEKTDNIVLKMNNLTPTQEELISRECSSLDEFFNVEIGARIQDELLLNDLQIQEIKAKLTDMGFFK
jgi:hypothetical protein